MRISLFATCLSELFYQDALKDMVEVLEWLRCDIDFPDGQTCCGQPKFNSGYHNEMMKAARQMIVCFEIADYIVTPSDSRARQWTRPPSSKPRLDRFPRAKTGTQCLSLKEAPS